MVKLALFVYVALVTTEFTIQVDHGVAVVIPVTGSSGTEVVSAQAPDQTVPPGMVYSVAQGVVDVVAFLVSVEQ